MNSSPDDLFDYPAVAHVTARPARWLDAGGDPAARLKLIPGRDQAAIERAHVLLVGAGAHGHAAAGLLRSGLGRLTLCDPDLFEVSNLSRQLGHPGDCGKPKAHRVARNLRAQAIRSARITSIALPFPEALDYVEQRPDVVSCLVDDNLCRIAVSQWARAEGIPAVIAGLSHDGLRWYAFLQEPSAIGPCIGCVYPGLEPVRASCVAACIKTVYAAVGQIIHFIETALMGWPDDAEPYNVREGDLLGRIESRRLAARRDDCRLCGE